MRDSIPSAIICLTGSELTRGETRDLNGSYLATELTELGVVVDEIRILPDDRAALEATFRELPTRADLVLVSGGLGPTADDLTVSALAAAFDRGVVRDEPSAKRMRRIVIDRGIQDSDIPANFYKQSEIVEGSIVVKNPEGLAPGSLVRTDRGFLVSMPGVPKELRTMFEKHVVPQIRERFHLTPPRILRMKLLGRPESWAEAKIQSLGLDLDKIEYGISAKPGELTLKFIARDPDDHGLLDDAREKVSAEFGEDATLTSSHSGVAGETGAEIAFTRIVHELLLSTQKTVATAESCTGGLIAKRLTDCSGSSAYLLGGVVAYQNDVKTKQLGVRQDDLDTHGAVSEPVARQMALGAQRIFDADYGIGVTGIAGPGGGSDEKPVGLVWIALACPRSESETEPRVITDRNVFRGDRELVRTRTALRALDLLRRELGR
jgi:nicotinamide-nucleotide amidase